MLRPAVCWLPRLSLPQPARLPRESLRGFSMMSQTMARPQSLDEFDVDFRSPIGIGNFGGVYPAQNRMSSAEVAIKLMSPACLPPDGRVGRTELVAGIGLEQQLFDQVLRDDISHPNVVDLIGRFDGPAEEADMLGLDLPPAAFEEPLHYFVMELLEGMSLQVHVEQSKGLPEYEARSVTRVLCEGLEFLHQSGIVHRDLKPSNVHYSHGGSADAAALKLIDFSTAGVVPQGASIEHAVFDEHVGTPGYVAPEVLFAQKRGETYNAKCDVFSLGCTLHAMLTNMYLPRRHAHLGIVINKELGMTLSPDGYSFLSSLLSLDPSERPTVSEALQHPWLQEGVSA